MKKVESDYLASLVVTGTAKEIEWARTETHAFFASREQDALYNTHTGPTDRDLTRLEVWCSVTHVPALERALGLPGKGIAESAPPPSAQAGFERAR